MWEYNGCIPRMLIIYAKYLWKMGALYHSLLKNIHLPHVVHISTRECPLLVIVCCYFSRVCYVAHFRKLVTKSLLDLVSNESFVQFPLRFRSMIEHFHVQHFKWQSTKK